MAPTSDRRDKKIWDHPDLIVYGTVEEITQDSHIKNKIDGSGDDVILNNQQLPASNI